MNITLNFTNQQALANITETQPLAVMPAELAKKLLKMYASKLVNSTNKNIILDHTAILEAYANDGDLQGAMEASISWLGERELIQNAIHENWSAYSVPPASELGAIHVDIYKGH